jgi:hypothetical protein
VNRSFDEIHVFEGVADRTGTTLDRNGVRGHARVCRSMTELQSKSRRLGDGYYYIASGAWPESTASVNLALTWDPMA